MMNLKEKLQARKAEETKTTTAKKAEPKEQLNILTMKIDSKNFIGNIEKCYKADKINSYQSQYLKDFLTRAILLKFIGLNQNYAEPISLNGLNKLDTIILNQVIAQVSFIYQVLAYEMQVIKSETDYKTLDEVTLNIYLRELSDKQKENLNELYNVDLFIDYAKSEKIKNAEQQQASEEINSLQRAAGLTETVQQ